MTLRRNTPLRRTGAPARRTPMNRGTTRLPRESAKHKAERPTRQQVVAAAIARDRNECQYHRHLAAYLEHLLEDISIPTLRPPSPRCSGPLDPHEVIPRDAWRAGYLVLDNVVMLCRHHHEWVTVNPTEAHKLKLHGYSWERPQC